MAIEIKVPRLGWSMEEGTFLGWLQREGASVQAGQLLFKLEGDKAVEDIEAADSGILMPRSSRSDLWLWTTIRLRSIQPGT